MASLIFCRRTSVLRTPVAVPLISKMSPLKARTLAVLLMVDGGSAMVSEIIWACTPAMKAACLKFLNKSTTTHYMSIRTTGRRVLSPSIDALCCSNSASM